MGEMKDMPGMGSPSGSEGGGGMATMHSYFYFSYKIQLLFEEWASESRQGYALTLAAVLILALFNEWFAELEHKLHDKLVTGADTFLDVDEEVGGSSKSSSGQNGTGAAAAAGAANDRKEGGSGGALVRARLRRVMRRRASRAGLLTVVHALRSASGYLLMLAIMSFNAGVFVAVLAGVALGFIFFRLAPHL